MAIIINREIVPDIDKVHTVRVAVAVGPNGAEGICAMTNNVNGTIVHTPAIWGDDKRHEKMAAMFKQEAHRANVRVEIREYVLKES